MSCVIYIMHTSIYSFLYVCMQLEWEAINPKKKKKKKSYKNSGTIALNSFKVSV